MVVTAPEPAKRTRLRLTLDGLSEDDQHAARTVSLLIRAAWSRGCCLLVDSPSAPEWPAATRRLAQEVCGPFNPARALGGAR